MFERWFSGALIAASLLLAGCGTKPTNLRNLVPGDAMIVVEINDLAAAVSPIVESEAFKRSARRSPDLAMVRGIQLAAAVTGFKAEGQDLTEEIAVGRIKPLFTAVVETHAWNYQARSFAENGLGEFVNGIYGGGVRLEVTDKHGGRYYTWTAEDGRKAYALVIDSLVYFSNDESSLEKCIAVRRGEVENISANPKIAAAPAGSLAFGYVSPEGIGQIASIAGVAMASATGEEEEVKGFIAAVLPRVLRSSIVEATWTSTRTERGVEDTYQFATAPDVSNVLSETLLPNGRLDEGLLERLPGDVLTATIYDLRTPQLAWRSALLAARQQAGTEAGELIGVFAHLLAEPYGINNAELFLSGVGSTIITATIDPDGERPVVIARVRNADDVRRSLSPELIPQADSPPGTVVLRSADGTEKAVLAGDMIVVGDSELVDRCLLPAQENTTSRREAWMRRIADAGGTSWVTFSSEPDLAAKVAEVLSESSEAPAATAEYRTETKFGSSSVQRRTISDLGLIGWVLAQLAPAE